MKMINANDARKLADFAKDYNLTVETEKAVAYTEGHIANHIIQAAADGQDRCSFWKKLFDGNWQMVIDNLTSYGYHVVDNKVEIIVYW